MDKSPENNKNPEEDDEDGSRGRGGGTPKKNWVQFHEESETGEGGSNGGVGGPAVIDPSVEIVPPSSAPARTPITNNAKSGANNSAGNKPGNQQNITQHGSSILNVNNLHSVELSNTQGYLGGSSAGNNSRRNNPGFTNGDVIVSVLPVNTKWPWVTPAAFRPELVPEELMVPGLTLTVEEYVHAMELLTSDLRFNAYTICYKRLLASWLSAAFFILLIILFSGVVGISLFALGIAWLIINACAVFLCMYIKIKINQGLERCMAKVNKMLIKHKLIVGLDDRGRISCHKVHLCFIYFDPTDCVKRLEAVLDSMEDRQRVQRHLDASDVEIVITGAQNTTRIPQKQKGERLFLRYVQRWGKDFLRRRLDWTVGEGGENPSAPRHLTSALCPCQYVEEYLRHKPITQAENSCSWWVPCFKLGN